MSWASVRDCSAAESHLGHSKMMYSGMLPAAHPGTYAALAELMMINEYTEHFASLRSLILPARREVPFTPKGVLSTILVKTLETKMWSCLYAPGLLNSNIVKIKYCKWAKLICERLLLVLTGIYFLS